MGAPVRTASLAIYDALQALGIDRIHLMSPYPEWLTEQTVAYWAEAGVDVVAVEQVLGEGEQSRAYETRDRAGSALYRRLAPGHLPAIV